MYRGHSALCEVLTRIPGSTKPPPDVALGKSRTLGVGLQEVDDYTPDDHILSSYIELYKLLYGSLTSLSGLCHSLNNSQPLHCKLAWCDMGVFLFLDRRSFALTVYAAPTKIAEAHAYNSPLLTNATQCREFR